MTDVVLVTGASSGIGEATARQLVGRGDTVFAGVRSDADGERLEALLGERLMPLRLDVTDEDQVVAAAEVVQSHLAASPGRRLAGIVNNAGIALGGPLEYLPLDDWRTQFEVNVFGQIAVTKAFLGMVRSGGGRIVFIGSSSGRYAAPLTGPYTGSKFAIEGIAESLRLELHDSSIPVTVIEPGAIRTPIWDKGRDLVEELKARLPAEGLDTYRRLVDQITGGIELQAERGAEPSTVAVAVERSLYDRRPRFRYPVGMDATIGIALTRLLPDRLREAVMRAVTDRLV